MNDPKGDIWCRLQNEYCWNYVCLNEASFLELVGLKPLESLRVSTPFSCETQEQSMFAPYSDAEKMPHNIFAPYFIYFHPDGSASLQHRSENGKRFYASLWITKTLKSLLPLKWGYILKGCLIVLYKRNAGRKRSLEPGHGSFCSWLQVLILYWERKEWLKWTKAT